LTRVMEFNNFVLEEVIATVADVVVLRPALRGHIVVPHFSRRTNDGVYNLNALIFGEYLTCNSLVICLLGSSACDRVTATSGSSLTSFGKQPQ
jgi:hypothetical protein